MAGSDLPVELKPGLADLLLLQPQFEEDYWPGDSGAGHIPVLPGNLFSLLCLPTNSI